jgi:thioredoxin
MTVSGYLKNSLVVVAGLNLLLAVGCGGSAAMNKSTENVKHVSQMDFAAEVTSCPLPVVIEFYATWCGPCKQLAPVMEQVAGEFKGRVNVVKINIDESPGLAQNYQIQAIPTVIFFKAGKLVDRTTGLTTATDLQAKLTTLADGK